MNYRVHLDVFEGPLDLLLYLVEEAELDIHEVSLARVADQFLDHLAAEHDIELASRFLVIAAQLMSIKAKSLLPAMVRQDASPEEEEDPAVTLAHRLEEYRRVKLTAEWLGRRWEAESLAYHAPDRIPRHHTPVPVRGEVTELARAMAYILGRTSVEVAVSAPRVRLAERIAALREILTRQSRLTFREFLGQTGGKSWTVGSFLALLELWRLGEADLQQEQPFEDIQVLRVAEQ